MNDSNKRKKMTLKRINSKINNNNSNVNSNGSSVSNEKSLIIKRIKTLNQFKGPIKILIRFKGEEL